MGKMPNPDVLACCHVSGKRTGAMTQEILHPPPPPPSGDSVGRVNTLTGKKTVRREAAGVKGEVIFHVGASHFRLGLKTSVAESKLRCSQQCASSDTIRVFHTSVPEL